MAASPVQSKHQQIVRWMNAQIDSGAWGPHHKLKSEPELASDLKVARGTVQKALNELVRARRLYRVRGKGTFVSSHVVEPSLAQSLLSLSEALDLEGLTVSTSVLGVKVLRTAPVWVREALSADSRTPILYLQRIKQMSDGPVAVLDNYLSLSDFPGLQRVDFKERRLFDVIERDYGFSIDWGSRVFDVVQASPALSRHLMVAAGTPLVRLEQVAYTVGNTPIECSHVWIRPDRVRLRSVIKREHT